MQAAPCARTLLVHTRRDCADAVPHHDGPALVAQLLELAKHILVARGCALGIAAQRLLNALDLLDAVAPLCDFRLQLLDEQPALRVVGGFRLHHLALHVNEERLVIDDGLVGALPCILRLLLWHSRGGSGYLDVCLGHCVVVYSCCNRE